MKATYNKEPEAIRYMPLPDGRADVWLRKDITQATDEDGNPVWEADEVYFRTGLSEEEATEQFDTLFESGGPAAEEDNDSGGTASSITLEERIEVLEAGLMELGEVIANG